MLSPVWNTLKLSKGISWDMYNEEASLFWGEEKPGGNVDGKDMWCGYYSSSFLFYANPGVSWEAVYLWGTAVSVVRNLPLTTDRSALILTQTLIKDASDRCFLWLTQPPTSKRVQTPSFSCRCWPCFFFFFFKYTLQETKDLETASIVSSTVDSSRGKLALEQNGPNLNLSNQQTQVEVKTWRCVLSVIV